MMDTGSLIPDSGTQTRRTGPPDLLSMRSTCDEPTSSAIYFQRCRRRVDVVVDVHTGANIAGDVDGDLILI